MCSHEYNWNLWRQTDVAIEIRRRISQLVFVPEYEFKCCNCGAQKDKLTGFIFGVQAQTGSCGTNGPSAQQPAPNICTRQQRVAVCCAPQLQKQAVQK